MKMTTMVMMTTMIAMRVSGEQSANKNVTPPSVVVVVVVVHVKLRSKLVTPAAS